MPQGSKLLGMRNRSPRRIEAVGDLVRIAAQKHEVRMGLRRRGQEVLVLLFAATDHHEQSIIFHEVEYCGERALAAGDGLAEQARLLAADAPDRGQQHARGLGRQCGEPAFGELPVRLRCVPREPTRRLAPHGIEQTGPVARAGDVLRIRAAVENSDEASVGSYRAKVRFESLTAAEATRGRGGHEDLARVAWRDRVDLVREPDGDSHRIDAVTPARVRHDIPVIAEFRKPGFERGRMPGERANALQGQIVNREYARDLLEPGVTRVELAQQKKQRARPVVHVDDARAGHCATGQRGGRRRAEEGELAGVSCERRIRLIVAIDRTGLTRGEPRMVEHELTRVAGHGRQFEQRSRLGRPAERHLDRCEPRSARFVREHAIGRDEHGYRVAVLAQGERQIADHVPDATDLAIAQRAVFGREQQYFMRVDGGCSSLAREMKSLAEHLRRYENDTGG